MKRIVALNGLLLISIMLLVACGSKSDAITETSEEKTVINVMHRWPIEPEEDLMGNLLADMFDNFESQNPDIVIHVDSVPSSMYEAQLNVRLADEDGPDVYILWPGGRAESQIRKGDLLDITYLWEENQLYDHFKAGIVSGSIHTDGKIYTLPIESKPNTFWYNKAIFEELDLETPRTWEELIIIAEKIKEAGYTPFAVSGNLTRWMPAFWFDYLLLNTAGGDFREDLMWGYESWESEEVYDVFELWKELVELGYFNDNISDVDSKEVIGMVGRGEAAMMLQGPWAINDLMLLGLEPEEDFDLFPFPRISEDIEPAAEGAILAWGVNPSTDVLAAVEKLMVYMSDYETVKFLSSRRNTLGARNDVGLDIYDPKTLPMMEGLNDVVNESTLYMNFELATLPIIQDAGMDAFIRFLNAPESYKEICAELEAISQETFSDRKQRATSILGD